MDRYRLERRGVVMTPDPSDPREAWGVLNPAVVRGRDGERYLLPRMVAENNYSRIGLCRVLGDDDGDPVGVERLGVALEPELVWERNSVTGGVEDPRITFIEALDAYIMTYAAYGPIGSRIGLAVSNDAKAWRRLGPVTFGYDRDLGADLNLYPNKDALWFPEPVPGSGGTPSLAMLHRPTWNLEEFATLGYDAAPPGLADSRPGIWVSFVALDAVAADLSALTNLNNHVFVAGPQQPWEILKIGGGTPPVRTDDGWMSIFHGVSGEYVPGVALQPYLHYAAGVMIHAADDVSRLLHRSAQPLLEPQTVDETVGTVPNVVFPTAIDVRGPRSADVYYGMADSRIGWAKLTW